MLIEGQETNLTCVAEGAIPAPSFSWLGAVNLTSIPEGGGVSLGKDDQHTAWQTVQYTARLNDSGKNIPMPTYTVQVQFTMLYSTVFQQIDTDSTKVYSYWSAKQY